MTACATDQHGGHEKAPDAMGRLGHVAVISFLLRGRGILAMLKNLLEVRRHVSYRLVQYPSNSPLGRIPELPKLSNSLQEVIIMHVQRTKTVVYKEFTVAGSCVTMTPFAMT